MSIIDKTEEFFRTENLAGWVRLPFCFFFFFFIYFSYSVGDFFFFFFFPVFG
jgi:hypothetical protein